MFGKSPRLNPLESRKQLLIAESELNRVRMVADMTAVKSDAHALIGRQSKQRFRIGDRLNVQVARVDKLLRRAYFVPTGLERKRTSR